MAKKQNRKSRIRISALIYLIAPVVILAFLIFNENGILKYLEVKDRVEALEKQINISEEQIQKIKEEIDSLKTDTYKIEKTAREKYNMKRPLEKGLDVKVKKHE